jgi:PhnB protein
MIIIVNNLIFRFLELRSPNLSSYLHYKLSSIILNIERKHKMIKLNPYLNFNGNAEEAFNFYKSVFGGNFTTLQRFKDTPEAGKLPENQQNKIMHISLPIGDGNVLMASDVPESMGYTVSTGNNIYISINTESEEETNNIFNGLSRDGKINMPLQKTFWNAYFGMLRDKFGILWMVSYEYPKQA